MGAWGTVAGGAGSVVDWVLSASLVDWVVGSQRRRRKARSLAQGRLRSLVHVADGRVPGLRGEWLTVEVEPRPGEVTLHWDNLGPCQAVLAHVVLDRSPARAVPDLVAGFVVGPDHQLWRIVSPTATLDWVADTDLLEMGAAAISPHASASPGPRPFPVP